VTVLAVDTSTEHASLVLLKVGQALACGGLQAARDGHSTQLFGEIQSLLRRTGAQLEDIDCFAAGAGPGSFTGVRVALAAVKGLAMALGKPMAAVSNLQALAWFGESPLRAVVIDARRGDVYTGLYNAALEPVRPEMVTKLDAWLGSLPCEAEIITANPALLAGHDLRLRVVDLQQMGRAIAHIAAGQLVDPALTDANYVRRADAEMNWVDR